MHLDIQYSSVVLPLAGSTAELFVSIFLQVGENFNKKIWQDTGYLIETIGVFNFL